jgi:hypothetical protein
MDTQDKNWRPVAEKLQSLFGPGYQSKDADRIRPKLLPLLIKELPQFDKAQIGRALDLGLRNLKTGIDWSRFSAAARPHITASPATVRPFHSYTLHGRLLNGLSQAVGYGDDAAAATNYPLVRIRHLASGKVTYCRTFDHSTMGVGTGAAVHSTNFFVPCGIPTGASEICVVANGIASPGEPVNVHACTIRWPIYDERIYTMLIGSLADGPLWVWGPHGPVPVDPMNTKAAAQVKTARKSIVKGLDALHELGQKLHVARGKAAGAQPLAADDDIGEAGGGKNQTRALGDKAGRKGANAAGQTKAARKRTR